MSDGVLPAPESTSPRDVDAGGTTVKGIDPFRRELPSRPPSTGIEGVEELRWRRMKRSNESWSLRLFFVSDIKGVSRDRG